MDGWTEAGSDDGPALIVDEVSPFVGLVSFVPLESGAVESCTAFIQITDGEE